MFFDCADNGFACVDPSASCVDDDDFYATDPEYTTDSYTTDPEYTSVHNCNTGWFSDGLCDTINNNEECGTSMSVGSRYTDTRNAEAHKQKKKNSVSVSQSLTAAFLDSILRLWSHYISVSIKTRWNLSSRYKVSA